MNVLLVLNLVATLAILAVLLNIRIFLMATLDDISTILATADAKITANTNTLSSVKARIDSLLAVIQALKDALVAAGNDPAKLQAVADAAQKVVDNADSQASAEATLANTDADPTA